MLSWLGGKVSSQLHSSLRTARLLILRGLSSESRSIDGDHPWCLRVPRFNSSRENRPCRIRQHALRVILT